MMSTSVADPFEEETPNQSTSQVTVLDTYSEVSVLVDNVNHLEKETKEESATQVDPSNVIVPKEAQEVSAIQIDPPDVIVPKETQEESATQVDPPNVIIPKETQEESATQVDLPNVIVPK